MIYAKTILAIVLTAASLSLAEFQVNTYTSGSQQYPAVAMDSAGNFVVVWDSSSQNGIFGQRFDSEGVKIGDEFLISNGGHYDADVAMNSSGRFVVTWWQHDPEDIFARVYDSNAAALTNIFQVNTSSYSIQRNPQAAIHDDGHFIVTWGVYPVSNDYYVKTRLFDSSGAPVTQELDVGFCENRASPDIAMDDEGNFVIVWDSFPLHMRRYNSDGSPLNDVIDVTGLLSVDSDPRIAMAGDGQFVIVWSDHPSSWQYADVYAQRFSPDGNSDGGCFVVNTYPIGRQDLASVAMNDSADFVVTWFSSENQDGSNYGVFGRKFHSTKVPYGDEFQINTFAYHEQWFSDVAMRGDGEFITVWQSYLQDGSEDGIFGQIGSRPAADCNCNDADIAGDGRVEFKDFALLAGNWQKWGVNLSGDLSGNGLVDFEDLKMLCSYWLQSCDSYLQGLNVQQCNNNLVMQELESETRFSITVQGNNLYFEDLIQANCCKDEIRLNISVEENKISIFEIETTSNPCHCLCDYPTTALLGSFEPGNYIVEAFDCAGSSLGFVEVTIPSQ